MDLLLAPAAAAFILFMVSPLLLLAWAWERLQKGRRKPTLLSTWKDNHD